MQTPWYLIIHAIEFSSEIHCYFSRLLVLFVVTVLQQFTEGVCQSLSARSHFNRPRCCEGDRLGCRPRESDACWCVPWEGCWFPPPRPLPRPCLVAGLRRWLGRDYPDAPRASTCFSQRSSYGKCCTGSVMYVLQMRRHLRFASVHGMPVSSPSHHFSGNPMRRPQQLQVIIIHWTYVQTCLWGSLANMNPRCVLHFMFNAAAPGVFSAFSYNYFWSLRCEII